MKMKKLLLLPALLLTLSVGNVACSYHNDDNPNEYLPVSDDRSSARAGTRTGARTRH